MVTDVEKDFKSRSAGEGKFLMAWMGARIKDIRAKIVKSLRQKFLIDNEKGLEKVEKANHDLWHLLHLQELEIGTEVSNHWTNITELHNKYKAITNQIEEDINEQFRQDILAGQRIDKFVDVLERYEAKVSQKFKDVQATIDAHEANMSALQADMYQYRDEQKAFELAMLGQSQNQSTYHEQLTDTLTALADRIKKELDDFKTKTNIAYDRWIFHANKIDDLRDLIKDLDDNILELQTRTAALQVIQDKIHAVGQYRLVKTDYSYESSSCPRLEGNRDYTFWQCLYRATGYPQGNVVNYRTENGLCYIKQCPQGRLLLMHQGNGPWIVMTKMLVVRKFEWNVQPEIIKP